MSANPKSAEFFRFKQQSRKAVESKIDSLPATPKHRSNSETSRNAALALTGKMKGIRQKVFEIVWASEGIGITRGELCDFSGILNQSACATLNELEEAGLIVSRGTRLYEGTGKMQKLYFTPENL